MERFDILVRGDGAVGLAAALLLAHQGLSVALWGAADSHRSDDVRAFALNAASVRLLQSLKVWDGLPDDARTAVHDMHIQGDGADSALDFSAWTQGLSELAWIVDAAELERVLRSAVRFAPRLTSFTEGQSAPPPAELEVLAEGKSGARRAELGVEVVRHAYGHTAIAARLLGDLPHAGQARQWFGCPDVLALLPLDRPAPGRGLALVWSLTQERASALMAASDAGFVTALMSATAGQAGGLQLCGARAAWPLALAQAQATHGPGWVLVGDAAHVVHPLAGQGLNLGLADVAALGQVLADRASHEAWRSLGDVRLLARYSRQRQAPSWAMAQVTDGLLNLFAHPAPWAKAMRNQGLTLLNRLPPLKRLLVDRAAGG